MGAEIDSLDIKIEASAKSANSSVDTLVGKLERLSASLGRVNGQNLTSLSNGVRGLANSMQAMKSVGTADFTRLATNISKIGAVDSASLGKAASSLNRFTNSLQNLDAVKVSDNAAQIGQLANGIKQLGYTSATKAIDNIPKLATAMRQLMTELSKAPKVSQNLIEMTNALAKLARTGASSGRAATSLGKSLDTYTASTSRASKGTFSLASALGKLYATYWLAFRALGKIKEAIDISSDLTEVQNVVDVTFGDMAYKVEDFAETSIEQFGMSELALKQYASRFQAMGSAMGINKSLISSANSFLNGMTNGYIGLSDSMSDVSLNLTKLTADMASFYNMEQSDVAEDLESIFTGQTRPLRTYGLDLTQATLQEWALKNGIDADIQSMSQAEKTMLRYQYVMANTGAAQGDFARTAGTWANQVRILKQNFEQLASIVGGVFINALKPLVSALNAAMSHIIAFAETVSNALGKIFGWKFESSGGGIANDFDDAAGSADDIAGSTGQAAKNIEKMKNGLRAFDELKLINLNDGDSGSGSGGSGSGGSSGGASGGQWTKQESILDTFKSDISSLYELGKYIGDTLTQAMNSIDWNKIYQGARNFGKGLADFLNGLISPELFGATGRTIAGALNTAIYAALSFGETFDWSDFGLSIATGINEFFKTFDFKALARTLNVWSQGIFSTIRTALKNIKWSDVWKGITDFISELDIDTVAIIVGGFALKHAGKYLTGTVLKKIINEKFNNVFASAFGTGTLAGVKGIAAGFAIAATVYVSFKFVEDASKWWQNIQEYGWDEGRRKTAEENPANPYRNGTAVVQEDGTGALDTWITKLEEWQAKNRTTRETEQQEWDVYYDNLSTKISTWWNEDVSPWFTTEKWKELGSNIQTGLSTKWGEFVEWWTGTGLYNWWNDNVSPWFTKEKWEGLGTSFKDGLSSKWNEFTEWWRGTGFYNWWHNDISPWFTKSKWQELGNNIKSGISSKWNEFTEWWRGTGFYNWWHNDVESFFTKDKWTWSGVSEGLKTAWSNAIEGIKQVWNQFATWLNEKLNFSWNSVNVGGKQIIEAGSINLGKVPTFATGGFPEDGLFMANHKELVGKFANGKTAVANNDQITQGIADAVYPAVYNAVSAAINNNEGQSYGTPEIRVFVGDRELTDIAIDGINERTRRTGRTPIMIAF